MVAPWPGWTAVAVRGRDRERFLHAQLTSDVRGLAARATGLTAMLDPTGRLEGFGLVHRREEELLLLVPEEVGPRAIARLERYLISDQVEIEPLALPQMRLALGPEAVRLAGALDPAEVVPVELCGSRGFITWARGELPLPSAPRGLLEALRVVTGLPRWGAEVEEGMLVTETSLMDGAVSLTKGCYLGQETVAKVATRRGPAYAPVLLEVDPATDAGVLVGREFRAGGRKGGRVLAWADWEGRRYLQASLFRDLRLPGSSIRCEVEGLATVSAKVVPLPLLRAPSPQEQARELHDAAVARFQDDAEEESLVLLERAIAVCPGFADATEALGVILGRLGRYEEALAAMRRLAAADPGSVMAHTNASLYLMKLGRIEEAEAEKAIAAGKALESGRRLQETREQAQREAESRDADRLRREEMFREVLELDPEDPVASFGLGRVLLERRLHQEARVHLERALAADPGHSAAHLALGQALEGLGLGDRAAETYRAGLEVAARRGDLATANRMQERLAALGQGR